jgi:PhzF family phenazine biosynthesis protein
MKINVKLLRAFTKDKTKGNPAGIVTGHLSTDQMQEVARQVGYSATAFVQENKRVYNLRFFSPVAESPLCVHAALATAYTLVQDGTLQSNTTILQTAGGNFPVTSYDDGSVFMEMKKPTYSDFPIDKKEVAAILNITEEEFADYKLQIVSTGKPKLLVPIGTIETLLRIEPDIDRMKKYCLTSGAQGFFLFTIGAKDPKAEYHARHFNPLTLKEEDPVCGVASGALGAYLQHHGLLTKERFAVEMGHAVGTDGKVLVDVTEGIRVGGYCALFGNKTINIE